MSGVSKTKLQRFRTIRIRRIVVKRQVSGKHSIQDNTTTPDVDGAANVEALSKYELSRMQDIEANSHTSLTTSSGAA